MFHLMRHPMSWRRGSSQAWKKISEDSVSLWGAIDKPTSVARDTCGSGIGGLKKTARPSTFNGRIFALNLT